MEYTLNNNKVKYILLRIEMEQFLYFMDCQFEFDDDYVFTISSDRVKIYKATNK